MGKRQKEGCEDEIEGPGHAWSLKCRNLTPKHRMMRQQLEYNPFVSLILILGMLVIFPGCSGSQNHPERKKARRKEIPLETLIRVNRTLVEQEQTLIKAYIKDNHLDMAQTGTGLWYSIQNQGEGPLVKKGQIVKLGYTINLLNGTHCYSSDSLGVKEFRVGQGGVESGLEEGILLLKNGSKASFIMAPHLAHGLMGDDDKIPARAILWYEVEVLDVTGN